MPKRNGSIITGKRAAGWLTHTGRMWKNFLSTRFRQTTIFFLLPKPEYRYDFPALVVELKWNKNAKTALDQIKRQHYPASIASYTGDILLVGVNYDKKTKVHECRIEKYLKSGEK